MKSFKLVLAACSLLVIVAVSGCTDNPTHLPQQTAWPKHNIFLTRASDGHQYLVYYDQYSHRSGLTHSEACDHEDCNARRAFYKHNGPKQ